MVKTYVQFLGTAGPDNLPSLLIFFDNVRYLFGCGEGTQRFCVEHKVRLSKVSHIFVPQVSWEQLGGMPGTSSSPLLPSVTNSSAGMMLTLADVGVKQLNIHGPANLTHFLCATRFFVCRYCFVSLGCLHS
jgi:ribonuclease Z